jgi:sec-independent protein translocase protein TatB
MFGIGLWELIVILIIALLVVGPERLPQLAAQAGRLVRDLRRMYLNMRAELGPEFEDIERGIRDIQSLDPRRQIREYSRELLNDISADAPEIKHLAKNQRLNLDKIGRELLDDDLLAQPLAETRTNPDAATPAANGVSHDATPGSAASRDSGAEIDDMSRATEDVSRDSGAEIDAASRADGAQDAAVSRRPAPVSRDAPREIETTGHYE